MINSRAEGRPRRTGRGPNGRWGAQTVQARTSARSWSKVSFTGSCGLAVLTAALLWPSVNFTRSADIARGEAIFLNAAKGFKPDELSKNGGELTRDPSLFTKLAAHAVSNPLIGGGVAEWLKTAVC